MRPWLQVELVLVDHPKTELLAKAWRCHPYTVAGFLFKLWAYCVEYRPDGNVSAGHAADVLNRLAEPCLGQLLGAHKTVLETLQEVGFVDPDGCLHDWEDYTGALLERRAKERERKRLARDADKARKGHGRAADRSRRSGARVEKSRVEKSRVEGVEAVGAGGAVSLDYPLNTTGWSIDALKGLDLLSGNLRPEHFDAACGIIRGAHQPQAVVLSIRSFGPGGMYEHTGVGWSEIGRALFEFASSAQSWNTAYFRGFLRRTLETPVTAAGAPATDADRMRALADKLGAAAP